MTDLRKRKSTEVDLPLKRIKHDDKLSFHIFKEKFSEKTMQTVYEMGYTNITKIQLYTIPPIMLGHDIIGIAKTGSGKTLAFLLPVVEKLFRKKEKLSNQLGAVIIAPTRELALQINSVLINFARNLNLMHALIIGGNKFKKEVKIIEKGVNIIVATPGRLLDHLKNNKLFVSVATLRYLVLDEVDKILDCGFEKDMKEILELLNNKKRQTIMFSATNSEKIQEIEQLALRNNPVVIDIDKNDINSTVSSLSQYYVLCPTKKRFLYLNYLLVKSKKKKVMVFFDTAAEVDFFYNFYKSFNNRLNIIELHGKKKQSTRTNKFMEFCNTEVGIIFCTDVAARGLDIPDVDVIIQFDAPKSSKEYIHRVGRTARGEGKVGQALLILQPSELDFINHLNIEKISIQEKTIPWDKIRNHQYILEDIVSNNDALSNLAKMAYKKYLQSYRMKGRKYFDGTKLKYEDVLLAFGIKEQHINYKTFFQSTFNYNSK